MAIQQRLDVRMNQQLVMTPQLQMAIKLLQMNAIDLQSFVESELLDNPFLSAEDGTSESANTDGEAHHMDDMDSASALSSNSGEEGLSALDVGWDSMYDTGNGASGQSSSAAEDSSTWEAMATADKTLRDHLTEQLGLSTFDPVMRFLGNFLIDAIDDAGYLSIDMDKTCQQLSVDRAKLDEALALVQGFDPTGVGARSLAECLSLQMEVAGKLDDRAKVVMANLELLARKDFAALARKAKCDSADMQAVCAFITSLNPKPGLQYGSSVADAVIPDVVVYKDTDGLWQVELNAEAMPRVLLNKGYDNAAAAAKGKDKVFMNEKAGRAQWLMKSLEQRAKTIFKTARAILAFQADFFEYGVESLQPMTLKTVAEAIGMHESTISRVTTGKYMQTPMGVFEFKYFFSSAINTTGGKTEVASESVRAIIRRLIEAEDKTKPLSDEKLVELLRNEGVDVARRTVAKYREGMGIDSSARRRIRL
ncbi:MAG: RNA polymerase factor sigma-54 [Proteobacteria bacterium]|nr:RNA polymerase factor sigma-54 [Pseudomonadota bacterium]